MNVAIVGSRSWPIAFKNEIRNAVASLEQTDVLVSGGCRGVDLIAEGFARERGLECIIYEAEWDRLGRSAGFVRNKKIVETADRMIALQVENSSGTSLTIKLGKEKGIPVTVIAYTEDKGLHTFEVS